MKPLQHRLSLLSLGSVIALSVSACSSDDDDAGGGTAGIGGGGGAGATSNGGSAAGGSGASSTAEPCVPDHSAPVPPRETVRQWIAVQMPGATCSDGSPYPIFVNYSDTSNNLMIYFEPGGACWDYASCSGLGGLRGAANPEGIPGYPDVAGTEPEPTDIFHMTRNGAFPVMRRVLEDNPMKDWNMVFVPYCTGDLHTGNNVMTYTGPNGEELVYRHNGHDNVMAAIDWMAQTFQEIPQLLVTGCSAGGTASLVNYHFIREGLGDAVQCSYMLDDSGPIFPSSGSSAPLHEKVRESWNVDPILDSLEGQFANVSVADIKRDFSLINTALADQYPRDRLSLVVYQWDLNYSVYSYESFYGFPDYATIHDMWMEDLALLREQFDTRDNLAYFMPYYRIDNCSHCLTIPAAGIDLTDLRKAVTTPWMDSDLTVEGTTVTLQQYIGDLLDDSKPLESYLEGARDGEGFTDANAGMCVYPPPTL